MVNNLFLPSLSESVSGIDSLILITFINAEKARRDILKTAQ